METHDYQDYPDNDLARKALEKAQLVIPNINKELQVKLRRVWVENKQMPMLVFSHRSMQSIRWAMGIVESAYWIENELEHTIRGVFTRQLVDRQPRGAN